MEEPEPSVATQNALPHSSVRLSRQAGVLPAIVTGNRDRAVTPPSDERSTVYTSRSLSQNRVERRGDGEEKGGPLGPRSSATAPRAPGGPVRPHAVPARERPGGRLPARFGRDRRPRGRAAPPHADRRRPHRAHRDRDRARPEGPGRDRRPHAPL